MRFMLFVAMGMSLAVGISGTELEGDESDRCRKLLGTDFSQTIDAPTQIIDAKVASAVEGGIVHCQVSGYVAPNVGFLLVLPESTWNGKFVELGCAGFCGDVPTEACDDMLRRGYACAVSDSGHRSSARGALWAYNNVQAQIDHNYRGAHVTALAGKAVLARYYGRGPSKSYFLGGSTGGRQAMMEAQRFPWDFDGIIAGVPSLSEIGIHMNLLWANRAFTDEAGNPLFVQKDLAILHNAVVDSCDLNDGVRDGLIGDPRLCAFDPKVLLCSAASSSACLTARQIEAVVKIYDGPVTSAGERIYMPGALKGSEGTWLNWFVHSPINSDPRAIYNLVREQFRYGAFDPSPGPMWRPEDFDFDHDYKRFGVTEGVFAATNPDLRRFKAAGGKLIAWAGWSDAAGMPLHMIDYYEAVERMTGGRAATQDFFRLFMLPGVGHGIGDGAFAVDWLNYLEMWVEKNHAPVRVVAFHIKFEDLSLSDANDLRELTRRLSIPWDPATIEFSRPVFPYPTGTRYLNHGNPRDAASFGASRSPSDR